MNAESRSCTMCTVTSGTRYSDGQSKFNRPLQFCSIGDYNITISRKFDKTGKKMAKREKPFKFRAACHFGFPRVKSRRFTLHTVLSCVIARRKNRMKKQLYDKINIYEIEEFYEKSRMPDLSGTWLPIPTLSDFRSSTPRPSSIN